MKINNVDVKIKKMDIEQIDDELIMYEQLSKQVIMFNGTASRIWNFLTSFDETNDNVQTRDIVEELFCRYTISKANLEKISDDVEEILQKFIEAGLIEIS